MEAAVGSRGRDSWLCNVVKVHAARVEAGFAFRRERREEAIEVGVKELAVEAVDVTEPGSPFRLWFSMAVGLV